MQRHYGIIGYPLSHSFSPVYFSRKFQQEGIDAVYNAYPIEYIVELPALLGDHPDLAGFNVTIPYKEQILPYLNECDADATQVGAVNCVGVSNGKLKGYNTDIIGFEKSLVPLLLQHHINALILGTGGASKAVAFVLGKLGIQFNYVSRNDNKGVLSYNRLTPELMAVHTLVINTTPLGMYPNLETFPPIPYNALTEKHLLYDTIYNPEETVFLTIGKAQGAAIKNGYEMLVLQAEASWEIWNR